MPSSRVLLKIRRNVKRTVSPSYALDLYFFIIFLKTNIFLHTEEMHCRSVKKNLEEKLKVFDEVTTRDEIKKMAAGPCIFLLEHARTHTR